MTTLRTLIDADTIAARVAELGQRITEDYRGRDLVLVGILAGSYVFLADLARQIKLDLELDFLGVRSYGDRSETSGVVQITRDLSCPIEGRDVLLVEDIVDSGLTMQYLFDNFRTRNPSSVRLAALLHKPARARVTIDIDYLGFTIEDVFAVGYGLDHAQRYRNLPDLCALDGLPESSGSTAK